MECKCSEISELEDKIAKLTEVLALGSSFSDCHVSCMQELGYLMEASWTAAESIMLKQDACLLPDLPSLIEDAYNRLIEEINKGLEQMNSELERLRIEDEDFHKNTVGYENYY